MSFRIVFDEIWMRGYLSSLREESALINEVIISLNIAKYSVDINSLPELFAIQHELEQMNNELSEIINALEEYQHGAISAAQILQIEMLKIKIPTILK